VCIHSRTSSGVEDIYCFERRAHALTESAGQLTGRHRHRRCHWKSAKCHHPFRRPDFLSPAFRQQRFDETTEPTTVCTLSSDIVGCLGPAFLRSCHPTLEHRNDGRAQYARERTIMVEPATPRQHPPTQHDWTTQCAIGISWRSRESFAGTANDGRAK
jgi:hypothetical protein